MAHFYTSNSAHVSAARPVEASCCVSQMDHTAMAMLDTTLLVSIFAIISILIRLQNLFLLAITIIMIFLSFSIIILQHVLKEQPACL